MYIVLSRSFHLQKIVRKFENKFLKNPSTE